MRGKVGLAVGFGLGYYLGARAGRERYVEIRRWIDRARRSELMDTAAEKARAVVDLGVERARDLIEHGAGEQATGTSGAGYSPSR